MKMMLRQFNSEGLNFSSPECLLSTRQDLILTDNELMAKAVEL